MSHRAGPGQQYRSPQRSHVRPHLPAVGELQTLSGKHLLPGFGEEEDQARDAARARSARRARDPSFSGSQEEQIAQTVQELSTLFKESERRLREVAAAKSDGTGDEVRGHPRHLSPPILSPHLHARGAAVGEEEHRAPRGAAAAGSVD